jgi:hypothetical protein
LSIWEDKPMEYGFALQDKWQNGNKNDFTVSFSEKSDGTMNWAYAFSVSEIDILKLEVQDYLLSDISTYIIWILEMAVLVNYIYLPVLNGSGD